MSVWVINGILQGCSSNESTTSPTARLSLLQATKSSTQFATSTFLDITYEVNSLIFSSDISHSQTVDPQNFTINSTGVYRISYGVQLSGGSATASQLDTQITRNGIPILPDSFNSEGDNFTTDHTIEKEFFLACTSGDVLTVQALVSDGVGTWDTDSSYISIQRIDSADFDTSKLISPVILQGISGNPGSSQIPGTFWYNTSNDMYYVQHGANQLSLRPNGSTQADFTLGTNLENPQLQLALNSGSEVSVGSGLFTVNANNITIALPGTYRVSYLVTAEITGSGGSPRRTLTAELNQNSGTLIAGSLGSTYIRDQSNGNRGSISATYDIITTSTNETIALSTSDVGSPAGTLPLIGGSLKIELVELS